MTPSSLDYQRNRDGCGLTSLDRLGPLEIHTSEVLVVGSGAAGLTVALGCAPRRTAVLSAGEPGRDGSSAWAQGGVAAALGADDHPRLHAADTVAAGAGLVEERMVEILTSGARGSIEALLGLGARFDRGRDGHLALGREGAHARRRILHARGDATGAEIMRTLGQAARRAAEGGHLEIFPRTTALDLVLAPRPAAAGGGFRVAGALALRVGKHGPGDQGPESRGPAGRLVVHLAPSVVLATGGSGGIFLHTTNPEEVRGDGLALAARAGARLMDLELVQFHPTALDVGALYLGALEGSSPDGSARAGTSGARLPLLTEALRGEGALLVDEEGRRFVADVHPLAELAPRDVVARAIHRHRAAGHRTYLDAREAVGEAFPQRFPTVFEACRRHGLDPRREPVPVIPAAHYHMGGVATDDRGRTSLAGLWACGEVAASGIHGANRLASNSLLEALVFGTRVAADLRGRPVAVAGRHRSASSQLGRLVVPTPAELSGGPVSSDDPAGKPDSADGLRDRVRWLMSERVGLVRSAEGLREALGELEGMACGSDPVCRNLLLVARLVTTAALARRESRGGHYREDFPEADPAWRCHLLLVAPTAEAGPFCLETRPVDAALPEEAGRMEDGRWEVAGPAGEPAAAATSLP